MNNPDFYSLFAYGSALLLSMFFANKYEKSRKKKYLLLSFLVTLLFCGCRFYVGNDYHGYYLIFDSIRDYNGAWILIEPAYGLLNLFFSFTPVGYFFVLFTCTLITYTIVFYILYKEDDLKWGIFAIYTLGFLIIANDQVRQMVAVSIFFLSLRFLDQKKHFLFLLSILLATTFHYSAAVCIIAILFTKVEIKKRLAIIFLVVAFLIKLSGIVDSFMHGLSGYLSFFNETYATKADNDRYYSEATFGIQLLYFFIVSFATLLLIPKGIYSNIYIKTFILGACLYQLFWGQMLFERISLYFFEAIIFAVPTAMRQKNVLCKVITIVCVSYFTLQSLFAMEKNGAVPYRTFINERLDNPIYDKDTQAN